MESGQDSSREAHHAAGHDAITRLENQGLGTIANALGDLTDLISYVEEGPVPKEAAVEAEKADRSAAPSLAIYLQKHHGDIEKLNQRLLELGAKISDRISQLKQILY